MYLYYKEYFKLIIAFLIICYVLFFATGCCKICGNYESSDISKYRNFDDIPVEGHPDLRLFPENLDHVETINNYYYFTNFPTWGNSSWEVVLDVTYSEENFHSEVERLSNYETEEYKKRKLKFDSNCFLFNFPTFIARYDGRITYGNRYQYNSIDESNLRIIYVYLYCPSRKNQKKHQYEIKLSSEYLPKNFYKNQDLSTLDGYFFALYGATEEDLVWFD